MNPRRPHRIGVAGRAFNTGAKYALAVGAAAATVGIVIGVVTLTGVGFKIATIIINAGQTIATACWSSAWLPFDKLKTLTLFATLVMTAMVCILMGCGIPTTATYIIMVTVAAPTLVPAGRGSRWWRTSSSSITACWRTSHRRWRWPPTRRPAWPAADPFKTGNMAFRLGARQGAGAVRLRVLAVAADHGAGLHLDGVRAGLRRLPASASPSWVRHCRPICWRRWRYGNVSGSRSPPCRRWRPALRHWLLAFSSRLPVFVSQLVRYRRRAHAASG